MIDKRLRYEIAQCKLMILDTESLHFDSSIISFIKSGSRCNLGCFGGTYKLLRGYPPSPQLERALLQIELNPKK
jgi:hypothetical protein